MYDGLSLDIQFYDNLSQLDTSSMYESKEWTVVETSAWKHVR